MPVSGLDSALLERLGSEIQASTRAARAGIEAAAGEGRAGAARDCAGHLRQIAGVLRMADFDAQAEFTAEAVRLAEAIAAHDVQVPPETALDLLNQALDQIDAGAADVVAGRAGAQSGWVDLFNRLRTACGGAEVAADELFSPDLDIFPPLERKPEIGVQEYLAGARNLRARYQVELLAWLGRAEPEALRHIGDVMDRLYELARFSAVVRLWWVAGAYVDTLQQRETADDAQAKVFRQLNDSLRDLLENGESSLPQEFGVNPVRLMLFHIGAYDGERSERVERVVQTYQLDDYFRGPQTRGLEPVASDAASLQKSGDEPARLQEEELTELRALLDGIETELEGYARDPGNVAALTGLSGKFRQVRNALQPAGRPKLSLLLSLAAEQTEKLAGGEVVPSEALTDSLAVATSAAQSFVNGVFAGGDEVLERAVGDLETVLESPVSRRDVARLLEQSAASLTTWLGDTEDFEALNTLLRQLRDISRLSAGMGKQNVVQLVAEATRLLDLVAKNPALLSAEVASTLTESMVCITEMLVEIYDLEAAPGGAEDRAAEDAPRRSSALYDSGLREVFIAEAGENLVVISDWLRDMGASQDIDRSNVNPVEFSDAVYVAVHTLKGNFIALRLQGMSDAYAAADTLLSELAIAGRPLPAAGVAEMARLREETAKLLTGLQNGLLPDAQGSDALRRVTESLLALNKPLKDISPAAVGVDLPELAEILPHEVREELLASQPRVTREPEPDPTDDRDSFSEDAGRALRRMSDALAGLEEAPSNAVTRLAEELGSLKGSARVAGIAEIGDLAHAGEGFLELVRLENAADDARVAPLLRELHDVLASYVTLVERGEPIPADIDVVARMASCGSDIVTPSPQEDVQPVGPDADDDLSVELLKVYCEEARQVLARVEASLRAWVDARAWPETQESVRRDLHTLKGGARMVEADHVAALSHEAETLLESVPESGHDPNSGLRGLLEELHDTLLDDVRRLEQGQPLAEHHELVTRIEAFDPSHAGPPRDEVAAPDAAGAPPTADGGTDDVESVTAESPAAAAPPPRDSGAIRISIDTDTLERLSGLIGDLGVSHSRIEDLTEAFKDNLGQLLAAGRALSEQVRELEAGVESDSPPHAEDRADDDPDFDSLELDRYGHLQRLSRDLSVTAGKFGEMNRRLEGYARNVENALQQQARTVRGLKDDLLRVRTVQFGSVEARLRHIVRRSARDLGKQVALRLDGAEVELDRAVLDGVTEALEHLVRNAVDHGIESPDERRAAGKQPAGLVSIACRRSGREIEVSVHDDGRGIDMSRLETIAREQGVLGADEYVDLQNVIALISAYGLTTAPQVTQISGRGVGMDVVRDALRRLGGNIQLSPDEQTGTRFVMRLPVSLAVASVMLIRLGDAEYAAPERVVVGVTEMSRERLAMSPDEAEASVEVRGEVFRLLDLRTYLGHAESARHDAVVPALLLHAGGRNLAVAVDELSGARDMVVKPLGAHLDGIPIFSGGALGADGDVRLVLDFAGVADDERIAGSRPPTPDNADIAKPRILVVDDSLTVRRAAQRDLVGLGIQVDTAVDGVDAQRVIAEHAPDLILLDIEMPRMNGYEFLEWLRNSAIKNVPVTVISSRAADKHRDRALELGANDFLGKPYLLADLARIISARLGYEIQPGAN